MPEKPMRQVRWYRLIHDVLDAQMRAGPTLADVVAAKWRLDRAGIPTHIVADWIMIPAKAVWPPAPLPYRA